MLGYWNDPEKTAESLRGGWFHTGDLGVIDEEGYLTIVDRKKDMIKTGGENVASREVEEVLYQHPAVAEVRRVRDPPPDWIEAVTAVVVARDGAHADRGRAHRASAASAWPRFKVPEVRRPRRRAAEEPQRQDPQARAARGPRRAGASDTQDLPARAR